MCAEEIQAQAKLCKHCKSVVKPRRTGATFSWLLTFTLLGFGLYLGARHVNAPSRPKAVRTLADQAAKAGRELLE